MSIKILMPSLSPTMKEGTLQKWLVKIGDEVKAGDVLAEIETDKATMEIEAVEEGRLVKIIVPEGTENVEVNKVIGLLLEEGEDFDEEAIQLEHAVTSVLKEQEDTGFLFNEKEALLLVATHKERMFEAALE